MQSKQEKTTSEQPRKRAWQDPKLAYVGDVEALVQGGEGKVSFTSSDPGEHKKTRPSEP